MRDRSVQVAEIDVLARRRIEPRVAGHRRDPAGQERVDVARVGERRGGRAREVRRVEHRVGRIVGLIDGDRQRRHQVPALLIVGQLQERSAEREAVRALQPVEGVVDVPVDRVPRRRRVVAGDGRIGDQRKVQPEATLVGEHAGRDAGVEPVRRPLPASLELVHQRSCPASTAIRSIRSSGRSCTTTRPAAPGRSIPCCSAGRAR